MIEYGLRTYRSAGETTPTATAVRTGALRRAYSHEVTPKQQTIELALGVIRPRQADKVLAYAAIHEFGGTIRPKRVHHLAIPLPAAKTARGVVRGTPRSFDRTFVKTSKAGNLILYQQQAAGIIPLFLLRRQAVQIPARPLLWPTWQKFEPDIQDDLLDAAVDVVVH